MAIEISAVSGADAAKRASENSRVPVAGEASTQAQQQTGAAPNSDTVTLSDAATRAQKLQQTIGALPVMESPRLEAIKRAIDNGSYDIDANRVAARMLDFEHALGKAS